MIVLALAVRFALAVCALIVTRDLTVFHSPDTASYIQGADALMRSGRFEDGIGEPDIVRTPGYPLLLIPGALLGNVELVAIALQIALSCSTVYLIYRTGFLLFEKESAARLGALLYALEPLSILYASKVLTETLFTTLVTLFLYLILKSFDDSRTVLPITSAVALAAAIYVRPIGYYFPIVMTVILVIRALAATRRIATTMSAVFLFFVISMGLVGLWQVRNATQAGYTGFSAIADLSWYFYQGASVLASKRGVLYYELWKEMGVDDQERYLATHPEQHSWSKGERYAYMGREGRRIVGQNLLVYSKIHLKGMLKTLLHPGGVEYLKMLNLYPAAGGHFAEAVNRGVVDTLRYLIRENRLLLVTDLLLGMMLVAVLSLSVIGVASGRPFDMAIMIVLALGLYLLVMSGGPQSSSRFRHPIMPILCVLAGHGLSVIADKVHGRQAARLSGLVG